MDRLFVYGTLRDGEVQEALFGERLEGQPGVLRGWEVRVDGSGYFFVRPASDGSVKGMVLVFPERHWAAADAWEGVPAYAREVVSVVVAEEEVEAYVDTRRDGEGEPTANDALAGKTREAVLRELRGEDR